MKNRVEKLKITKAISIFISLVAINISSPVSSMEATRENRFQAKSQNRFHFKEKFIETNRGNKRQYGVELVALQLEYASLPEYIQEPFLRQEIEEYSTQLKNLEQELERMHKICEDVRTAKAQNLLRKQSRCIIAAKQYEWLFAQIKALAPTIQK